MNIVELRKGMCLRINFPVRRLLQNSIGRFEHFTSKHDDAVHRREFSDELSLFL